MRPPPWPEVPHLVKDWISDAGDLRQVDELMITEALAELHARFERMHPFLDGNGRAGRLVLDLLLVRLGYPPAIIYKASPSRYLAALRRADDGDTGPLGEFLARAVLTTSTSSSCPQWPVRPDWCRSPRCPRTCCRPMRYRSRPRAAG